MIYAVVLMFMIVSVFCLVAVVPICRKRESLWIFIMISISFLPLNILISKEAVMCLRELFGWSRMSAFAFCPLIYAILYCVEQILCGLLGRIIWKSQYKPGWKEEWINE